MGLSSFNGLSLQLKEETVMRRLLENNNGKCVREQYARRCLNCVAELIVTEARMAVSLIGSCLGLC